MALGRNTRHALHCQRSPPTLLQTSQDKSRLTEQCTSRSTLQLQSTMWTINNCSIVSSTPTYRQQSVAGSTTICRADEPTFRKMKIGVVQGGVLSPALSNYYLAEFPTPPPNIKLIKYADDIAIYTSGPVVADPINGINIYLSQVFNYINNNKLTVSTAKSTVTLFTPDTHEHHLHPQVMLADQVPTLVRKPKGLGVTLDTHLTFTQHCNNIAVAMLCLTFLQHLIQLIILSLYTVYILTLDLLILSFNDFHLI